VSEHIKEHVGLLDAIVNREPERAAALAEAHVRHFEQAIRSVL
jgi:DNA-binding GntR family transcriptional regulator